MSRVLVTGGAGYVGSHAVLALQRAGYQPIVLDNLVYGHREQIASLGVEVIVGDIGDAALLDQLFRRFSFSAVLHFAAYAYVGESVLDPGKYYRNNVAKTIVLLEAMSRAGIDKLIFSSTCATYGIPEVLPMTEDQAQRPINPYGHSKWMVEQILRDFDAAHALRSVVFRYFNAAGADPEGRLGEQHDPETHLIPLVLQTALGKRDVLKVFGDDYPTPDGSCIRDYIHVSDLADAHVQGLRYLEAGQSSDVFNLGTGQGCSVFEVIKKARKITGKEINLEIAQRRPGDPPALFASPDKARKLLDWIPRFSEVEVMIEHAWRWESRQ